tara:strand:- start:2107 stop:2859 length:753 start_codon:yes stop_codon:yes gene_type:complete
MEIKNLVLITSVINPPNKPLSYSNIRSVYNREVRFEQTKLTIKSIKEKIPNSKIIIVECTNFTDDEKNYFNKNCDYILNLWEQKELHSSIFGLSKSLGEGTQMIKVLEYIIEKKIKFDNLFKISGRYWLSNNFNYNNFDNSKLVFKKINNNNNNIFTGLYKIPNNLINNLYIFLLKNIENMKLKIGFEILFGRFLKNVGGTEGSCETSMMSPTTCGTKFRNNDNISLNIIYLDPIGLQGFVTVCGSKYDG